jgi:hypothetical protein
MTYPQFDMRFSRHPVSRRSAYANFVAYFEFLSAAQLQNRRDRHCIVRLVRVKGVDGTISASEGWDYYCRSETRDSQRNNVGVVR